MARTPADAGAFGRAIAAVALVLCGATIACRRAAPVASAPPAPATTSAAGDGAAAPSDRERASTLLGGERGVDHVGIGVADLDAATRSFHDLLGFSRPTEGRLPNGIRNVNYYFADATYLETMVPWDRERAAWLADFTAHHSGAVFAVLAAWSAETTTAYLARRGIKVGQPYSGTIQTAGETAMPEEKWKTFFLPEGLLAGDPIYFIAYPRGPREDFLRKLTDRGVRRVFYHDNTALGLNAVWIAVSDLAAATRAYESIGLEKRDRFRDEALEAEGQAFGAGLGEVRLLAAAAPASAVTAFLRERGGPGVLGVTLWAGSVPAAARLIGERTGTRLPAYEGRAGNSIRVPPAMAHGVWIEFAQHLVPRATP